MADLFDHLEDAERAQGVADPAAVLTDDQLEEGGLRQVRAFVRTRASRNALRVQKHREKAAAEGLGQVNVVAPEAARDALKAIAKRTAGGEPLEAVLRDLAGLQRPQAVPGPAPAPKVDTSPAPERPSKLPEADALVVAAAHAPGLRGWLINRDMQAKAAQIIKAVGEKLLAEQREATRQRQAQRLRSRGRDRDDGGLSR